MLSGRKTVGAAVTSASGSDAAGAVFSPVSAEVFPVGREVSRAARGVLSALSGAAGAADSLAYIGHGCFSDQNKIIQKSS